MKVICNCAHKCHFTNCPHRKPHEPYESDDLSCEELDECGAGFICRCIKAKEDTQSQGETPCSQ
jgi:hypothetical protein